MIGTKSELWANPDWCIQHWGARRGLPWTATEYAKAWAMRLAGADNDAIASRLKRSVKSVNGKIGYRRKSA